MAMQTRRDAGRSGVSKGFHGRGAAQGRKPGRAGAPAAGAAKSFAATDAGETDRDEATDEGSAVEGSRARGDQKRRRLIDPTTCERDYSSDEVEFMKALDEYKRKHHRNFPTCSEILEVLKGLGYRKEPQAAVLV